MVGSSALRQAMKWWPKTRKFTLRASGAVWVWSTLPFPIRNLLSTCSSKTLFLGISIYFSSIVFHCKDFSFDCFLNNFSVLTLRFLKEISAKKIKVNVSMLNLRLLTICQIVNKYTKCLYFQFFLATKQRAFMFMLIPCSFSSFCSSKLVCKLTGDTINKSEEHIWKHINGKRFLNKLGSSCCVFHSFLRFSNPSYWCSFKICLRIVFWTLRFHLHMKLMVPHMFLMKSFTLTYMNRRKGRTEAKAGWDDRKAG